MSISSIASPVAPLQQIAPVQAPPRTSSRDKDRESDDASADRQPPPSRPPPGQGTLFDFKA